VGATMTTSSVRMVATLRYVFDTDPATYGDKANGVSVESELFDSVVIYSAYVLVMNSLIAYIKGRAYNSERRSFSKAPDNRRIHWF